MTFVNVDLTFFDINLSSDVNIIDGDTAAI